MACKRTSRTDCGAVEDCVKIEGCLELEGRAETEGSTELGDCTEDCPEVLSKTGIEDDVFCDNSTGTAGSTGDADSTDNVGSADGTTTGGVCAPIGGFCGIDETVCCCRAGSILRFIVAQNRECLPRNSRYAEHYMNDQPLLLILPTLPDTTLDAETSAKVLSEIFAPYIPFRPLDAHPDVLWYGKDEPLGIAGVRQSIGDMQKKPFQEHEKYAVFLHADSLKHEAQNALLKTLEEPPAHTRIILVAEQEFSLLPTIRSRCLIVRPNIHDGVGETKTSPHTETSLPKTISESIHHAELLKDRAEAVIFCTTLLHKEKVELEKTSHSNRVRRVQKLAAVLRDLKRNINVRLAMESLFFTLAKPEYFV